MSNTVRLRIVSLDLHDRAIVGVIIAPRPVFVVEAKSAVWSEPSFPCTTTVRTVRDAVGARRVAHSSPESDTVSVGAVHLVTGGLIRNGHQRVTPLEKQAFKR